MMKAFFSSFAGQIIGVLLLLAVVSACSSNAPTPPNTMTLAGTQWNLKTLDSQAINNARPPTLNFEASRMNGFAGCNQYFGNYTGSTDGVFSTSAIGSTKIACIGAGDQLEQQFFAQLGKASQYALTREQLHLLDTKRNILMVFTTAKSSANKPQ